MISDLVTSGAAVGIAFLGAALVFGAVGTVIDLVRHEPPEEAP